MKYPRPCKFREAGFLDLNNKNYCYEMMIRLLAWVIVTARFD